MTLLVVDDHLLVRQGIMAFLDVAPDLLVLGEASAGEEAVRMAAELTPLVVSMDLIMPGIGGVESTPQVKQVSPRTQIVVLNVSSIPLANPKRRDRIRGGEGKGRCLNETKNYFHDS